MAVMASLPPTIERHELKYAIPEHYIEPICRFIEPYCSLDSHSSITTDQYYQVNSLYFDTRSLEFLQQRLYGKDGRFNVRVRCYGDAGEPPYFLEIKQKSGVTGKKYRSVASPGEWPAILTDPSFRVTQWASDKDRINKELFLRIATSYAIEPKLLTQYKRRAYFSTVDDYARVTLDVSMKYRVQDDYNLSSDNRMVSYDNETIYARDMVSEGAVILELKSIIGQVPMWMLDLISTFDLKQQGFSKYVNSTLVSHLENGLTYMTGDRMSLHHHYE